MPPVRLIFAGSGAFGLPTLAALKDRVICVVSQPDRPAGRGRHPTPTPIAQYTIENNLPLVRTADINAESLPDADVMVVIAFGQKIAPHQVNHPRLGSINLHGSLLPRFRGAAPVNAAILAGDAVSGNSIIRLAELMDAGAILAQSKLTIGETETAGELHDRLSADGPALVERVLQEMAAGSAVEAGQRQSQATAARKLSRRDTHLDWSQSGQSISLRIRGLWPWPGCHVRLLDAEGTEVARVALARTKAAESEGSRWRDGEIDSHGRINAAGGASAVEILELQPEGRRVMSLADFRRGHAWMPGMRLESIVPE